MKFMHKMKKVLSLLLVFVLIAGMLPVTSQAAESKDVIFFATDRHEESSKLNSLLEALDYTPGLVVLGGDHVNNTNSGSLATITSEIQSVYPGVQTFFTYAAHDPNVTADSSNPYAFARTGEYYKGEDYYVYGVDQDDMQSASDAATASSTFVDWADNTAEDGKVIFVMCHMPIHKRRGDNAGGATWLNALNEVSDDHDVVFLWGHNHTGESADDTSVYFVSPGSSITPQGGSSTTIQFTYMNAGYIKNGYATMAVISDDSVVFSRYNTSGSVTDTNTMDRQYAVTEHVCKYELTKTVEATCGEDGYEVYTCSCGDSYEVELTATGEHDYTTVTTDATCGTDGSAVSTCGTCGHVETEVIPATGEHNYTVETTEADCENDGSATYTCGNCGDTYTETIDATGHSYSAKVTAATCLTGGYTTYTCTACGDSYVGNETEALGHTYTAETVEATCNEAGYTTYTCACGDTYTDPIPATGEHSYEAVTVEATCNEDGYTTYTCACGDTYTDPIPATGEHSYEAVTVEATCEEAGSIIYTCACGESYTETIDATGHDYEAVVTAPSCETEGCTTYTCANCGDSYTDDTTEALGHDYESVTVEADCDTDGCTTHTCTNCGDSYTTDVTAALGHSYTAVVTDATCTQDGYTTYTCETCGDSYTADVTDSLGHSYTSVITEATCTQGGYTTFTCETCGDSYTADATDALGHNYTCEEADGSLVYTCTSCGDSYEEALETISYTKITKLSSGNAYVVTVYSGGNFYALSHSGNKISSRQVTVSDGEITSSVSDDLIWNYSSRKLSYQDNGTTYYLYSTSSTGNWGGGNGNVSLSVSSSKYSTISLSSSRLKVGSYYLRYSNGTIQGNRSAGTAYVFQEATD